MFFSRDQLLRNLWMLGLWGDWNVGSLGRFKTCMYLQHLVFILGSWLKGFGFVGFQGWRIFQSFWIKTTKVIFLAKIFHRSETSWCFQTRWIIRLFVLGEFRYIPKRLTLVMFMKVCAKNRVEFLIQAFKRANTKRYQTLKACSWTALKRWLEAFHSLLQIHLSTCCFFNEFLETNGLRWDNFSLSIKEKVLLMVVGAHLSYVIIGLFPFSAISQQ